ncbi:hypothetical protein MHBO_001401 [Bonamia ostreae]|uniref:Translation initiation factor eIF2B subunit delta n=1 Tax=Bonamia ostreae TaxID=126728 RepID=A0ABV2AIT6_9EUKA
MIVVKKIKIKDSPDEYIKKANNSKDMEVLKLWREIKSLKILNLRYDIVPSHFATLILTEHGSIPPSSVSVINGRYNKI